MNIKEARERISLLEEEMHKIEGQCLGSASWNEFCLSMDSKYQSMKAELLCICKSLSHIEENTEIY